MNLRYSLLVVAVLLCPSATTAQEVAYGVKGGINFATIAFDPEPGADFGLRPGLVIGGFVTMPLGARLAIQPEGLFSQKGTSASEGGVDAKVRLDYLEVPVLVRYVVSESSARTIHAFGGPALAFKLRANSSADFGGESVDTDIDEDIEDFDVGIVFGAGVDFGRLTAEGRYTLGLSNISADPDDPKARNRTLAFLAGVRF